MAAPKQHGGARAGAGRKPSPDGPTVTVTVSVPSDLVVLLDAYANEHGWKRSEAVTQAIRGLLKAKR